MDNFTRLINAYGIVGYLNASAVELNGLHYPLKSISGNLARYCGPLFHSAGGEGKDVSTKGSATFLSMSGRYFAGITKHQYEKLKPEEVSFPSKHKGIIAVGGDYFVPEGSVGYGNELCFLDLGKHVESGTLSHHNFLPLDHRNYCKPGDDIRHGVSYGFAFDDLIFEYDETGEHDFRMLAMHTKLREYNVKFDGASFDDTLCKWKRLGAKVESLSGFSGGPTFAIVRNDDHFVAKLAGINMMSNNSILHTVKINTVRRYLKHICETDQ